MLRVVAWRRACALAVVSLMLTSCGYKARQPENVKKTIPVRGEVIVDGKPGNGVQVMLVPKDGHDPGNPSASLGDAGPDGKFEVRTYGSNDGAPAGDYVLTFQWFVRDGLQVLGGDDENADKFRGRYTNPKTSKHPVTVGEDQAEVEIPRIELTTQ